MSVDVKPCDYIGGLVYHPKQNNKDRIIKRDENGNIGFKR